MPDCFLGKVGFMTACIALARTYPPGLGHTFYMAMGYISLACICVEWLVGIFGRDK